MANIDIYQWRREHARRYNAKIMVHSKLKVLGDVRRILLGISPDTLHDFQQSCFGHLLDFDSKGTINGLVLHQIISRQIDFDGMGPKEAWFHIGDEAIRWSKVEFCLTTGLKFGSSDFDPNATHDVVEGGLWSSLFNGRLVAVDELWRQFNNQEYDAHPNIAVRIALIVVAELVLFGADERHSVRSWIWALAENRQMWDEFPWGKYSYLTTLHYLDNIVSPPRPTERQGQKKIAYHFFGFVMAMQIWAFEAIPALGEKFGVKSDVDIDAEPRFRRWKMPKHYGKFENILTQPLVCLPTLEASESERRQRYWVGIDDDITGGTAFIPPEAPGVFARQSSTMVAPHPTRRPPRQSSSSPPDAPLHTRRHKRQRTDAVHTQHRPHTRSQDRHQTQGSSRRTNAPRPGRAPDFGAGLSRRALRDALRDELPSILDRSVDRALNRVFETRMSDVVRRIVGEVLNEVLPGYRRVDESVPVQPSAGEPGMDDPHAGAGGSDDELSGEHGMDDPHAGHDGSDDVLMDEHMMDDPHVGHDGSDDALRDGVQADVQHDSGHLDGQDIVDTPCTVSAGPSHGVSSPMHPSTPVDHTPVPPSDAISTPLPPSVHTDPLNILASASTSSEVDTTCDASVVILPPPTHPPVPRDIRPSRFLRSPYVDINEKRAVKKTLQLQKAKYAEFLRDTNACVHVGLMYMVKSAYFTHIQHRRRDLATEHIEPYMEILAKRIHSGVDIGTSARQSTIVDATFFFLMKQMWNKIHPDDIEVENEYDEDTCDDLASVGCPPGLVDYVIGKKLSWSHQPWSDVRFVILICNVENHWITCRIRLRDWVIEVYDSLSSPTTDRHDMMLRRARQLMPLRRLLPPLLDIAGYWGGQHSSYRGQMMQVQIPDAQYHQDDIHSCGLFALMYIESLISGRKITKKSCAPDEAQIVSYRKQVAFSIYVHSEDTAAFEIDMPGRIRR